MTGYNKIIGWILMFGISVVVLILFLLLGLGVIK